jgi:hypothetical protein
VESALPLEDRNRAALRITKLGLASGRKSWNKGLRNLSEPGRHRRSPAGTPAIARNVMHARYYESDVTRLLRDMLAAHPEIEQSQREGRALFWDRKVDFEALERERQSEVPMKGYPYDSTVPEPRTARLRHG